MSLRRLEQQRRTAARLFTIVLDSALFACVALVWTCVLSTAPDGYAGHNACDMSFMFPRFTRVDAVYTTQKGGLAANTHALYKYEDNRRVAHSSPKSFSKSCVVVSLFVPGTGGSHKQARSLGSATYEVEVDADAGADADAHRRCRVDHYALDFNGELSIYNGKVLARQGASVRAAVAALRRQYLVDDRDASLEDGDSGTRMRLVIVGHSAGGLAVMDGMSAMLLSEDTDERTLGEETTIIHVAAPLAWNPVSLTYASREIENAVAARWRASGGDTKIAMISIVGGRRDRQVSSRSMGTVEGTWVRNEYHGWSARADELSRVKVSTDHQCAMWCKQLVRSLALGIHDAFPDVVRARWLSSRERVDALSRALGREEHVAKVRAVGPFGIPERAYEATQERTPSVLAGIVANIILPPRSCTHAALFIALAHVASPIVLRARALESILASAAVYAASGRVATTLLGMPKVTPLRALGACAIIAHMPSLIAWVHAVAVTFRHEDARLDDYIAPFGAMDAVALLLAVAPLLRHNTGITHGDDASSHMHDKWMVSYVLRLSAFVCAAYASAPGAGGWIPCACACSCFSLTLGASAVPRERRKQL